MRRVLTSLTKCISNFFLRIRRIRKCKNFIRKGNSENQMNFKSAFALKALKGLRQLNSILNKV